MKSGWMVTLITVAVASILAAMLGTTAWALIGDAGAPSGHAYTYEGGRKSFTADLAAGRVSTVKVNLSESYMDVTSDTSTYRVGYPTASEVFALLAQHPRVHVSVATSPTSPIAVFVAALAVAAAGCLFMLAGLRLLGQRAGAPMQHFGEGRPGSGHWAQAARVAILVVAFFVVLSVGMSLLVELAIR
jgi:NADH:ubiquinone oxidoreductase subunit 3 (subunit A)